MKGSSVFVVLIIITAGAFLIYPKYQKGEIDLKSIFPRREVPVYEYYWGTGCRECRNIEGFLGKWPGRKSVSIKKIEVVYNKEGLFALASRTKECKIANDEEMSVPVLYTPDGECYQGEADIVEYLNSLEITR